MTIGSWLELFGMYKSFYDFKLSHTSFKEIEDKQDQIETGEWCPDR